ncbi:hypothetical protein V1517DRAFT_152891 [Lipomyces orientalis]|uniref:Uncharacterized protein n=1 Tax=Lipomyces orientalis TaxID=1233043 RepID=A0ACC3TPD8_9ASCO
MPQNDRTGQRLNQFELANSREEYSCPTACSRPRFGLLPPALGEIGRRGTRGRHSRLLNADFVLEMVSTISTEEAINILENAIKYDEDDPNFPHKTMSKIKSLVDGVCQGEKDECSDLISSLKQR